jgi:hypothetical protein
LVIAVRPTLLGNKHFIHPNPKATILEGMTRDEMRIFEALFKRMSDRFGLRTIEKPIENPHFIFCFSCHDVAPSNLLIRRGQVVCSQTKILERRATLSFDGNKALRMRF